MKFDLSISRYVEWEVSKVMPLKGKFGYRVFLIYMDGSKISQQKSGFATEKEANEAREKTIGELYSEKYIVYANVQVKEFLEFWVEEDIKNRVGSNETYETYSYIVHKHIIPILGKRKMADINRGDVQELYNQKAEFSVSVARLVKTVMNVSMRYAVEKKVIAESPAKGIPLPKKVEKKKYHTRNIDTQKTLNMEQIQVLIEASKNTPIHMQVLFNVLMGLRRREINGVKYSDVDYINRTLKVQRQLGIKINTKKEDLPPDTYDKQEVRLKTQSSYRELPIPDYVFEAILEERKIYERNRSRRGIQFTDSDYICCSNYGKPRSKDFHWGPYKKLLRENNLPDIRWHDLRSTFCTLLLKNDFNPKAVSKLMGHAKELITMDVYGDNRGIIADCVDELQPFIEEVMPSKIKREELKTENMDIVISAEEYFS
jgi:integrase